MQWASDPTTQSNCLKMERLRTLAVSMNFAETNRCSPPPRISFCYVPWEFAWIKTPVPPALIYTCFHHAKEEARSKWTMKRLLNEVDRDSPGPLKFLLSCIYVGRGLCIQGLGAIQWTSSQRLGEYLKARSSPDRCPSPWLVTCLPCAVA